MGGTAGGLNRQKKTPEEIAAEQAQGDQDDFTSKTIKFVSNIMKNILNFFFRVEKLDRNPNE